ncbi:MAG: phosphoribosylanthranilate isomerase [Parvularculaceae bacterium]
MIPFKICCIQSTDEADAAIAAGALAVGLVGPMPNGAGPIPDELISAISMHVRDRHGERIWRTLLTSRTDGGAIADHVAETGVNTVQIVDRPERGAHDAVRRAHRRVRIIQVIHVEDAGAIEQAREAAETADVILLDSGRPSAAVRTLGGTGDTHDWSISRRTVETVGKPVFLAGGLNPQNAVRAFAEVRPFGLDICSGLRDAARGYALDPLKLVAFAATLRSGIDAQLNPPVGRNS